MIFEMTCLCLRSRQAQFCRERKDLWQFGAFQIVTEDKVTQQQNQHLNSQSCDKETLHHCYHGLLGQLSQGARQEDAEGGGPELPGEEHEAAGGRGQGQLQAVHPAAPGREDGPRDLPPDDEGQLPLRRHREPGGAPV